MTGLFSRRSNPFLFLGLKQAGLLWTLLLLLTLADFQWAIHPLFWAIRCLIGPTVPLLTMLLAATPVGHSIPIVLTLMVAVFFLYWLFLGALAAKMAAAGQYKVTAKAARAIFVYLLGMVLAGGLFTSALLEEPRDSGPDGPYVNAIINNLRQIEGAKDQFAIEKRLRPGHIVTDADLAPYLKRTEEGQLVPRCGTERYVLNPIGRDAYAVCEAEWWEPRRGWDWQQTGANGTIYTLTGVVHSASP